MHCASGGHFTPWLLVFTLSPASINTPYNALKMSQRQMGPHRITVPIALHLPLLTLKYLVQKAVLAFQFTNKSNKLRPLMLLL